jgi:hypothetical protein
MCPRRLKEHIISNLICIDHYLICRHERFYSICDAEFMSRSDDSPHSIDG